jgi:hypothetical protein
MAWLNAKDIDFRKVSEGNMKDVADGKDNNASPPLPRQMREHCHMKKQDGRLRLSEAIDFRDMIYRTLMDISNLTSPPIRALVRRSHPSSALESAVPMQSHTIIRSAMQKNDGILCKPVPVGGLFQCSQFPSRVFVISFSDRLKIEKPKSFFESPLDAL